MECFEKPGGDFDSPRVRYAAQPSLLRKEG